jgi:hypothetical protein
MAWHYTGGKEHHVLPYRAAFTEEAAQMRDSLSADRRDVLERGLAILVTDPRHKLSHPEE